MNKEEAERWDDNNRTYLPPLAYQSTYPHGNKVADENAEALFNAQRPKPEPDPEEETWEGEGGAVPTEIDVFDSVEGMNGITLMRIYDVLFAMLDEVNPDKATKIADLHRVGDLLMSSPKFSATFFDDGNKNA